MTRVKATLANLAVPLDVNLMAEISSAFARPGIQVLIIRVCVNYSICFLHQL